MNTRRIVAMILAAALCFSVCAAAYAAELSASAFRDYDPNAWYAAAVSKAVSDGLLQGKSRDTLDPNGLLLRSEMMAIVNRAFGCWKEADIRHFTDIQQETWYYRDAALAVQMGTYNGTSDSTMEPERPITRQEAMAVAARALQLDTDRYQDVSLSRFPDAGMISAWAVPYIRAMVGCGYILGRPCGLAPQEAITRAEFAQIFGRILRTYVTEPGTYTNDYDGNLLIRCPDVILRSLTVHGDLFIGCGAADGRIVLDDVTVTGRLVVWGGGTNAVFCSNSTNMPEVLACRVDGPVKVIYDLDSTLAVYDTILAHITQRAAQFPETEIVFAGISGILDTQKELNAVVRDNEISVRILPHIFALVGEQDAKLYVKNESADDVYTVTLERRSDGARLTEPLMIAPGAECRDIRLLEAPIYGNEPCIARITSFRGGRQIGTVCIELTLHAAYLWSEEVYEW